MPGEDIYSWSPTATLNGGIDGSINFGEGQPRASVNDSARSLMAALAKQRNQQNGSIVTGGTANAQTFASGNLYTVVPTGMRVMLKIGPSLTNTAAATLNMDNIGDVAIKTTVGDALAGGELIEGTYAEFVYDGTNWIRLPHLQQVIINNIVVTTTLTTIDFTGAIDGTYDSYLFTLRNIVATVDGAALWFRVSEDAGATWKSGAADYTWVAHPLVADASFVPLGDTQDSEMQITNISMSSNPANALDGTVRFVKPAVTTTYKKFIFDATNIGSGGGFIRWLGAGAYIANTHAINGVRFMMSTGDFAAGSSISLSGITA